MRKNKDIEERFLKDITDIIESNCPDKNDKNFYIIQEDKCTLYKQIPWYKNPVTKAVGYFAGIFAIFCITVTVIALSTMTDKDDHTIIPDTTNTISNNSTSTPVASGTTKEPTNTHTPTNSDTPSITCNTSSNNSTSTPVASDTTKEPTNTHTPTNSDTPKITCNTSSNPVSPHPVDLESAMSRKELYIQILEDTLSSYYHVPLCNTLAFGELQYLSEEDYVSLMDYVSNKYNADIIRSSLNELYEEKNLYYTQNLDDITAISIKVTPISETNIDVICFTANGMLYGRGSSIEYTLVNGEWLLVKIQSGPIS